MGCRTFLVCLISQSGSKEMRKNKGKGKGEGEGEILAIRADGNWLKKWGKGHTFGHHRTQLWPSSKQYTDLANIL